MNRLRLISENLRSFLAQDYAGRWQAQEARYEELARLLGELEQRASARADAYERAVDARIDERAAAIERRLDSYEAALDARLEERLGGRDREIEARLEEFERRADARSGAFEAALTERASGYEAALDARLEERLGERDAALEERFEEFERRADGRAESFERALTGRAEAHEAALDARTEGRLKANEEKLDGRLEEVERRLDGQIAETLAGIDQRFDARAGALDGRVDDRLTLLERNVDERLTLLERNVDERFDALERRSDARMETHERKVDGKIHQTSQDIVDRTDIMLQLFEQRLDRLRREPPGGWPAAPAPAGDGESGAPAPGDGGGALAAADHRGQLTSFRKLAESGARPALKLPAAGTPLYHQILAWKETAREGLDDFTPAEQETVDYILSFMREPKEIEYTRQHLRRFLSTLERVPPPERPDDRLLELGSLFHLAPAIKKYGGYGEVYCADFWDSDEKRAEETVSQRGGADRHTFELRNFNVERDPFPYPDGYFSTVLCCELIEHLQRDPMHMLWECNRVLAPGGHLLLTTPNIASCRAIEGLLVGCAPYLLSQYNLTEVADQHNREYAPYEVGLALAAAGFTVLELETEDVWMRSNPAILELLKQVQISTELRGDNIFALARKTGPPVERYPKELYTD